ncbi:alpha-crystallin A chain-like [Ornithodoros turicata]|uniref:alpha-crystallin A chain-like n=1 Tax=Ornithodoros turicata TaxID=34597 RepID=UPI003139AC79
MDEEEEEEGRGRRRREAGGVASLMAESSLQGPAQCHCSRSSRGPSPRQRQRCTSPVRSADGHEPLRGRGAYYSKRRRTDYAGCPQCSRHSSPVGDGLCQSHPSNTQFKVVLDVHQFNPEDVTVKTCGNHIIIQAVRREDRGRSGIFVKEFTRKYLMPDGGDPDRVSCSLTEDGFLTVRVPVRDQQPREAERVVPITYMHGYSDRPVHKRSSKTVEDDMMPSVEDMMG